MQQRTACGCTLAALLAVCLLAACSADTGLQEQDTWRVLLPKGSQPEGIAAGDRNDIWVACLSGNIVHVVSPPARVSCCLTLWALVYQD